MQKLRKRTEKNTPTDAPQVRGNCGLSLNKEETLSVPGLKTSLNNPEVDLSQRTGSFKGVVYVLSIDGKPLMPCKPAKAKKLLKSKRAKVKKMYPFTIQLNFECENQVQDVTLGVDAGYKEVGFSAVSEGKELASGTLTIDGKTTGRLTEKRMYRRHRRSRLWYRQPRFLNRRNKKKGWLAPSVQRRYDAHLRLIVIYRGLLPITQVIIETASFDIQKIENPDISGTDYQQGDMYGYQNMKAYIIAREKGKCQLCNKEKGGDSWNLHHIIERKNGGTNMAKNIGLLHSKCHNKLHKKGLKLSPNKQFKAETFMSIIHKKLYLDVPNVKITYGYRTFVNRNKLSLEKTHYNDAFVISGGINQDRISPIAITQKHRNNRSLGYQRKGFSHTSRKQRYKIQPSDLVWVGGEKRIAKGCMNLGKTVLLENGKTIGIKKIEKVYNYGSYVFN